MRNAKNVLKYCLMGLLTLAFLCGAGFGENAEGGDRFVGEWFGGRPLVTIECTDDIYEITVIWGHNAWEYSEYTMTGTYDAETDSIICEDCRHVVFAYDEDGTNHEEVIYTDGEAIFTLVDGAILWYDVQENVAEDIEFLKNEEE